MAAKKTTKRGRPAKPDKKKDDAAGLARFVLELYPKLNDPANAVVAEAILDAAQITGVLSQAEVDEARAKKNQVEAPAA